MPRGTQTGYRSMRAARRRASRSRALGMEFSYQSKPSPFELAQTFEDLADQLLDFSEVWPRLAPALSRGLRRNLISQGGELGVTWKPLTLEYAKRKGGGPMLRRTGALLADVSRASLLSSSRRFADVGIASGPDDYAHDMHYGFARGGKTKNYVEGRPFMSLSRQMISESTKMMGDHVDAVLVQAGRRLRGAR